MFTNNYNIIDIVEDWLINYSLPNHSSQCPDTKTTWISDYLNRIYENDLSGYPHNREINMNDTIQNCFINVKWIRKDILEIGIKSGLVVPIVLCGILMNVTLLHLIFRCRQLRLTPTNLLIANMAAADLLSLLICPWMFLLNDFYQNYVLGEIGCRLEGFLECSLLLTSVMSLSTISYDRLTAIVLPREKKLTKKKTKTIIIITWVAGILISAPLILNRFYKERQWIDFLEKYCKENQKIVSAYWHFILALIVWLPLAVMLICYSAIFIKLDQYEQEVLKREHLISVCYKTKVARMVFIVVITFIICRLPFTAFIFVRGQLQIKNEPNQVTLWIHILWFISKTLIYVNAAINPIIYGLTNDNFRRAFRSTPLSRWMFSPSKTPPPKVLVRVIGEQDVHKNQNISVCAVPRSEHTNNKTLQINETSPSVSPNISTKLTPASP